ncbi:MAG: response regulator transcription factor [Micrococcaceae bacterium]
MANLLLIEDDATLRKALTLALKHKGHEVVPASNGAEGLVKLSSKKFDLVILDVMLPDINGIEVCKAIRQPGNNAIPVIMMTAKGEDEDVLSGLEAGADDYIVKPVEPAILNARIAAVLRRTGDRKETIDQLGDLEINRKSLTVKKSGQLIELSPTEIRLFMEISEKPGQVFTRQDLLTIVWGKDYLGDSRLIDACVHRLRQKLEDNPQVPVYIQTVSGFGYRFGPVN